MSFRFGQSAPKLGLDIMSNCDSPLHGTHYPEVRFITTKLHRRNII